ncbi:MAG: radical SAM protein [Spirochaetales bacterium]|nr:radical SAM protein [Spirochaetales bacterium]
MYDLYLKPFGLLRAGAWLEAGGWDTVFVDALDYEDRASAALLGPPKRRADGTGKFFRQRLPVPPVLKSAYAKKTPEDSPPKHFARYGIIGESFRERLLRASRSASPRRPDLILITSGMTYWYPGLAEAAETCRALFPGTSVAVGGVYASLMPEHCKKTSGADAVVSGGGGELAAVLERLGLPVPPGEYPEFPPAAASAWKDAGVLRLNTGCPFRCDYCASHLLSPRFRAGSAEAAFQAFTAFMDAGIRNFAFYDDALLAAKEEVFLPFLERVTERFGPADAADGPRFYLPNAVHIQSLDSRTANLMRRAGFQEIRMGFESSSPGFHKEHTPSGAKFNPESFPDSLRALRAAGFPAGSLSVYILAGLPGQRAEEVEESIHSVRESCPQAGSKDIRIRLAEFSPVPGSALWEKSAGLCRYPLAEEPLFHNNSLFPMEWEHFTRRDLLRLKSLAASVGRNGIEGARSGRASGGTPEKPGFLR